MKRKFSYLLVLIGLIALPLLSNCGGDGAEIQFENHAPSAEDGSLTTTRDTSANGKLTVVDLDGDPITCLIVTNGSKGTAAITDASTDAYTYTPNANENGPDSFTFKANDGAEDSNTATITVNIEPPVPDTGQTTSFTDTFGEDSDYTINPPSYTDNGDETITDNVTGFMWQKEDDNTTRTWSNAGSYCDALTLAVYTDWRLPEIQELTTILNLEEYSPAINSTYFTNTNSSGYWSSTTYASNSSYAWYVNFYYGSVSNYYKSYNYYDVRCVRGGQ